MEGRRGKRGRGKTTGGHGRVAEKKKKTQVMNDKEEQDRLEAASVLSTLMFLPPKSSNRCVEKPPVSLEPNGVVNTTSTVTYISAAPPTGIPTHGPPPLQGTQSMAGGSGAGKIAVATPHSTNLQNNRVIIAQLQNQINCILKNGQTPPQIQLMMPLQAMQVQALRNASISAALTKATTTVPSVVMSAEPTKLPVTVNAGQTVNKNVASALRQAVTSTNKKQMLVTDHPPVKTKNLTSSRPLKEEHSKASLSSSVPDSEASSIGITIKKENSDNTLPLKKRRLIAIGQSNESKNGETDSKTDPKGNSQNIASTRFSQDLTTATQMENILQMAREYSGNKDFPSATSIISNSLDSKTNEGPGYRPVQIDPRTSLMILSDVKLALTPDQDGDLPIHIAVVHMNLQLVQKLIDIMGMTGKSVDRFNKLQQTPLHLAVLVDQPEIVKALLVAGANPNLVDRLGRTALHIAIAKKFPECMRTVYAFSRNFSKVSKVDIRLNTRNYEGYPPLHTCIDNDDLAALDFLVKNGANVDIQDGKAGRSALLYAVENNRVRMVDYLIIHRASAEMQNYAGVSPLMVAQSGNMTEIVQILQKALDLTKAGEEPADVMTKKVPIPRIPSKASMIVSEASARSRSNSIDSQSTVIRGRPRSMSTCSSPIDLSLHRNTESPRDNVVTKEDGDKSVPSANNSNVKEKHTQLVAALEGRQVQSQGKDQAKSQGQVQGQSIVQGKVQSQTKGQEQARSSYYNTERIKLQSLAMQGQAALYAIALAQARNNMVNKSRGDSESLVTSSSDINIDKVKKEVTDSGDNVVSEGATPSDTTLSPLTNNVNDKTMDTYGSDKLSIDQPLEKEVKSQEMNKEKAPPEVVISSPKEDEARSVRSESPDAMEIDENHSVTNSPASISKSPEMPVLSRMASFTNDQESCTPSLDLPEIENEVEQESSDTISDKENTTCVTQSHRSQESQSSSQGFETDTFLTKTPTDCETEGEDCTQKSDISDDSVELDSNTVAKARLSISDQSFVDKNEKETDKNNPNIVESNEMEIGEEDDEDKPLVIDEGPEKTQDVISKQNISSPSKAKQCDKQSDPVGDDINLKQHNKDKADQQVDECKLSDTGNETITNSPNGKSDKNITVNENVEKNSILSKNHSNKDCESSNPQTDTIEINKSTGIDLTKDKLAIQSSETDTNKISSPSDTKQTVNSAVKDSVVDSEKTVQKADTGSSVSKNDPGETNLNSMDHLLKEGKAHTLFYHDGEGYKPIRVFIDNSEQSSMVLQRMLQANFASVPPKQANSSEAVSSSNSQSQEKHDKTNVINDSNKEKITNSNEKLKKQVDDKEAMLNREKSIKENSVNCKKKSSDHCDHDDKNNKDIDKDKVKTVKDEVTNVKEEVKNAKERMKNVKDKMKVIKDEEISVNDKMKNVKGEVKNVNVKVKSVKDEVKKESANFLQSKMGMSARDIKTDKTDQEVKVKLDKASSGDSLHSALSHSVATQKATLEVFKTMAREAQQVYQMKLKQGQYAKRVSDQLSKVNVSQHSKSLHASDSSDTNTEIDGQKDLKIAEREKAFHEGFLAATKTLANKVSLSQLNKEDAVRNTPNDTSRVEYKKVLSAYRHLEPSCTQPITSSSRGDDKPCDVSSSDKVVKKLKQDSIPSTKSISPTSTGVTVSTVSSTSSLSKVLTIPSSLLEQISQKPPLSSNSSSSSTSSITTTTNPKPSGFHPGRSSLPEGTLTRINPDIKSRLSMALQSPQRKLSKPNIVLDPESKLVAESLASAQRLKGIDGVTSQQVSDSRQQL